MGPSFPPGGRARRRHSLPLSAACAAAVVAVLGGGACRSTDPNSADVAEAVQRVAATATSDPPVRRTIPPATSAPGTSVGTTVPPATSTTMAGGDPAADEAAVRATIDRFWVELIRAVDDPGNSDTSGLRAVLAGEAESRITGFVDGLAHDGRLVRLPPSSVFRHQTTAVVFADGDTASTVECVVDDSELIDQTTGAVINGGATTSRYESLLRRSSGQWVIELREEKTRQDGVAQCER